MNLSSEIIWLLILTPLDFINLLISLLDKFLSIIETKLTTSLPILEISIFVFGKFSPDELSEKEFLAISSALAASLAPWRIEVASFAKIIFYLTK